MKIVAQDRGSPSRSDVATVEVVIIRDRGQLRFGTQMYRSTISENRAVGQSVTKVQASPSVSITCVQGWGHTLRLMLRLSRKS